MRHPSTRTKENNKLFLENMLVPASIAAGLIAAPALAQEPAPADTTSNTPHAEELQQTPTTAHPYDQIFTIPGIPRIIFDPVAIAALTDSITTLPANRMTSQSPIRDALSPDKYYPETARVLEECFHIDQQGDVWFEILENSKALEIFRPYFAEKGLTGGSDGVWDQPSSLNNAASILDNMFRALSDKDPSGHEGTTYNRTLVEYTGKTGDEASVADDLWNGRADNVGDNPNTLKPGARFKLTGRSRKDFITVAESYSRFAPSSIENDELKAKLELLLSQNQDLSSSRDVYRDNLEREQSFSKALADSLSGMSDKQLGVEAFYLASSGRFGAGLVGTKGRWSLHVGGAFPKDGAVTTDHYMETARHPVLPVDVVSQYTMRSSDSLSPAIRIGVSREINDKLGLGLYALGDQETHLRKGNSRTFFLINGQEVDENVSLIDEKTTSSRVRFGPGVSYKLSDNVSLTGNAFWGLGKPPEYSVGAKWSPGKGHRN
jgi:hypothetical protein